MAANTGLLTAEQHWTARAKFSLSPPKRVVHVQISFQVLLLKMVSVLILLFFSIEISYLED